MEINRGKLDELYKEWSGEHHTTNSNKPTHDSAECTDFAEYCLKYGMSGFNEQDLIQFWKDANSYQSIDVTCFDIEEFKDNWIRDKIGHEALDGANGVTTEKEALHIDSVMPRFSVSLVYQNATNIMLRCLILNAKDKSNALVEAMEHFAKEADGMGLVLKTVIELNEA
jgi:hypothetical protein